MTSADLRYKDLLAIAHHLADLSGPAILPHFRKAIAVDNKADGKGFDPVTIADRAAERVISKALARDWPEHGIVGEEHGERTGAGRYRWIIDPIDGTRGFITGSPMWGTLIGLMDADTPRLGLMDQPFTRERIWSGEKGSTWRQSDGRVRRIKTRACARLADAVLMSTTPDMFKSGEEASAFERVRRAARVVRYGGDCYAYCLLAAGHVDLVVEAGLKPYDTMALVPIIERAGGRITTWDGASAAYGGRIVAAGDPRLHDVVLRLLASSRDG